MVCTCVAGKLIFNHRVATKSDWKDLTKIHINKSKIMPFGKKDQYYFRAFHVFGQVKFAYGGMVLGSNLFNTTAPAASKNDSWFISGQK